MIRLWFQWLVLGIWFLRVKWFGCEFIWFEIQVHRLSIDPSLNWFGCQLIWVWFVWLSFGLRFKGQGDQKSGDVKPFLVNRFCIPLQKATSEDTKRLLAEGFVAQCCNQTRHTQADQLVLLAFEIRTSSPKPTADTGQENHSILIYIAKHKLPILEQLFLFDCQVMSSCWETEPKTHKQISTDQTCFLGYVHNFHQRSFFKTQNLFGEIAQKLQQRLKVVGRGLVSLRPQFISSHSTNLLLPCFQLQLQIHGQLFGVPLQKQQVKTQSGSLLKVLLLSAATKVGTRKLIKSSFLSSRYAQALSKLRRIPGRRTTVSLAIHCKAQAPNHQATVSVRPWRCPRIVGKS